MVNPVVTLLFDLFLIGSALAILAAMVQEYLGSRRSSVGGCRTQVQSDGSAGRSAGESPNPRHRRALRKVA